MLDAVTGVFSSSARWIVPRLSCVSSASFLAERFRIARAARSCAPLIFVGRSFKQGALPKELTKIPDSAQKYHIRLRNSRRTAKVLAFASRSPRKKRMTTLGSRSQRNDLGFNGPRFRRPLKPAIATPHQKIEVTLTRGTRNLDQQRLPVSIGRNVSARATHEGGDSFRIPAELPRYVQPM